MSSELVGTSATHILRSTHEAAHYKIFENKLISLKSSSSNLNPEVSPYTAQIMQRINDLKIEYSSGALMTEPSSVIGSRSIEESLFDARADVKILTSRVSMYLRPELRKNLFGQLDLIHDPEDWDIEDKPVTQLSFKSFLRWFLLVSPERSPGLGLSSSGNLIAAWIDDRDRLILEFLPNDKVKWIVTRQIDDESERGSGQTVILRLPEVLAPYDVDNFFKKKD